jgi:protein-S-isoprenylcysteine O-methyltransferase Ste14
VPLKPVFALVDGAALVLACLRDQGGDRFLVIASVLMLVAWQVVENGFLRRRFGGHAYPAYPGQLAWAMAAFAAVLAVSVAERLLTDNRVPHLVAGLGLALCGAGIALRLSAFLTLGEEFVRPPGEMRSVVARGPYSVLRHPAGWGLLAIGVGAALAWGAVWGVVAAGLLLFPSVLYVNAVEERAGNKVGGWRP